MSTSGAMPSCSCKATKPGVRGCSPDLFDCCGLVCWLNRRDSRRILPFTVFFWNSWQICLYFTTADIVIPVKQTSSLSNWACFIMIHAFISLKDQTTSWTCSICRKTTTDFLEISTKAPKYSWISQLSTRKPQQSYTLSKLSCSHSKPCQMGDLARSGTLQCNFDV